MTKEELQKQIIDYKPELANVTYPPNWVTLSTVPLRGVIKIVDLADGGQKVGRSGKVFHNRTIRFVDSSGKLHQLMALDKQHTWHLFEQLEEGKCYVPFEVMMGRPKTDLSIICEWLFVVPVPDEALQIDLSDVLSRWDLWYDTKVYKNLPAKYTSAAALRIMAQNDFDNVRLFESAPEQKPDDEAKATPRNIFNLIFE